MRRGLRGALWLGLLRALLLGGVLALLGGMAGFYMGLLAFPVTLLEYRINKMPPPSRHVVVVLVVATWVSAFVLLAGARAQAIYTSEVLAGAALPDGFAAIQRELYRLCTTHPEDIPIAHIHFEALFLGSCAIAAPVSLTALMHPRPLKPGSWTGQRGEYAGVALVAYFALVATQTVLTTVGVMLANGRASEIEIVPFVVIIAGVLSLGSTASGLVAFWTTERLTRGRDQEDGPPTA